MENGKRGEKDRWMTTLKTYLIGNSQWAEIYPLSILYIDVNLKIVV